MLLANFLFGNYNFYWYKFIENQFSIGNYILLFVSDIMINTEEQKSIVSLKTDFSFVNYVLLTIGAKTEKRKFNCPTENWFFIL